MDDRLVELLREATGAVGPIRLRITDTTDSSEFVQTIDTPFALIGRATSCDVTLNGAKVSSRHAYLQVIGGQLFCMDLGSRNGVHWADGPQRAGWLTPGHPVRIGSFSLELVADQASGTQKLKQRTLEEFSPLDRYAGGIGDIPEVQLEFLRENAESKLWPINRLISLAGQVPGCKIRIAEEGNARVHCSLVRTTRGLWVIDLLRRKTVLVNDRPVGCQLLEEGDLLDVQRYRMRVKYPQSDFFEAQKKTVESDQLSLSAPDELPPFPDVEEKPSEAEKSPDAQPDVILAPDLDAVGAMEGLSHLDSDSSVPDLAMSDVSSLANVVGDPSVGQGELEEQREALRRDQDQFQQDVEAFQQQQEELQRLTEELDGKRSELQQQTDALQQQQEEFAKVEADVEQRAKQLEDERAQFLAEQQSIAEERAQLESQRGESQQGLTELEAARAELEAEREQLAAQRTELQQSQADLEGRIAEVSAQSRALDEAQQQLETEKTAQQQELQTQQEQVEQQATQQQQSAEESSKLEQQLEAERSALNAERAELQKQREEFDSQQGEFSEQQATLKADRSALQEERMEVEQERVAIARERADMDAQIAESSEARQELEQLRTELNDDREQLDAQRKQLETEQQTLRDEREKLAAAPDPQGAAEAATQAATEKLQAERETLADERRQLDEDQQALRTEQDSLLSDRESLAAQQERLRVDQQQFTAAVAEFELQRDSGSPSAETTQEDPAVREELEKLRGERDRLQRELSELKAAEPAAAEGDGATGDAGAFGEMSPEQLNAEVQRFQKAVQAFQEDKAKTEQESHRMATELVFEREHMETEKSNFQNAQRRFKADVDHFQNEQRRFSDAVAAFRADRERFEQERSGQTEPAGEPSADEKPVPPPETA